MQLRLQEIRGIVLALQKIWISRQNVKYTYSLFLITAYSSIGRASSLYLEGFLVQVQVGGHEQEKELSNFRLIVLFLSSCLEAGTARVRDLMILL